MSTMSAYLPVIPKSRTCQSQESSTEKYVRTRNYRLKNRIPPTVLDFEKNLGPQLSRVVLAQMTPMERKLVGVTRPNSRATTCGSVDGHRKPSKELPHELILSMGVKIEEKQRREYEYELQCRADAAIAEALDLERSKCAQIIETEVDEVRKAQLELQKVWRKAVRKDYKRKLSLLKAKRYDTDKALAVKLEEAIRRTQGLFENCDPKLSCELDVAVTVKNARTHERALKATFAVNLQKVIQQQKLQLQQDEINQKLRYQHVSMLTTSARTIQNEITDKLASLTEAVEPESPEIPPIVAQMLEVLQKQLPPSEILEDLEVFLRGFGCEGLSWPDEMLDLTKTGILLDETCITTFIGPNDQEKLAQIANEDTEINEDSSKLSDKILKILIDFKFNLQNPNVERKIQETIDQHPPQTLTLTPKSSRVGSFLSAVDSLEVIHCPRSRVTTPPSVTSGRDLLATSDSLVIHHEHIRKSMELSKTVIKLVADEPAVNWNHLRVPKYFKQPQPLADAYNKMRVVKFKQKSDSVVKIHVPPDSRHRPRRSSLKSERGIQRESGLKQVQFDGNSRTSSKLSL